MSSPSSRFRPSEHHLAWQHRMPHRVIQTSLSLVETTFPHSPPGGDAGTRAVYSDVVVIWRDDSTVRPARPPMTDLHRPVHPVRFVTAASLFDGHDAAINIMRRLLQAQGAEVVHLGHNRSVDEVVRAVVEEDAQGVAVSSYQGGHMEYFRYLVDRLR